MISPTEVTSQSVFAGVKANKAKRSNTKADGRALRSALDFSSRDRDFFLFEGLGRLNEPPANTADAGSVRIPAKTTPARRSQVDRAKCAAGASILDLELGSDTG